MRLNEQLNTEHFALEEAARALASNPAKIIENDRYAFSAVDDGNVVGVCALFKDSAQRFQLACMAVEPTLRGKGYGRALMAHAIEHGRAAGATSVYLLSNTVLESAIALYQCFGFIPTSTGQHPIYARCNIVMERNI